jgi:hypothetical protein
MYTVAHFSTYPCTYSGVTILKVSHVLKVNILHTFLFFFFINLEIHNYKCSEGNTAPLREKHETSQIIFSLVNPQDLYALSDSAVRNECAFL